MIEADVSVAAFDAFAVPGDWAGADVDLIIDREVELVDNEGHVRGSATRLSVKADQVPAAWAAGDVVTATVEGPGGDESIRVRIAEQLSSDGYITEFLAHPVSP